MRPVALNVAARLARIVRKTRVVGRGSAHTSKRPNDSGICSAIASGCFLKFAAIAIVVPLNSCPLARVSSLPRQQGGGGGGGFLRTA